MRKQKNTDEEKKEKYLFNGKSWRGDFSKPPPPPPLLHWLGNNNTSYIVFLQKQIADNVTAPQKPQYGNPFRHVDYVTCQSVFRLIGLFRDSRYDGVKINAFPPLSMM